MNFDLKPLGHISLLMILFLFLHFTRTKTTWIYRMNFNPPT